MIESPPARMLSTTRPAGLASILAAALLYYLVERPFLRLRGVLLARRAAPVTVQAA